MTPSTDLPRVRRLAPSTCAALLCAVVFITAARPAQAGVNVRDEPRMTRWELRSLASHPATPLYIQKAGGGAFAIDQVSTCVGDCDGNDKVAINELIVGVNIALERQSVNTCPAFGSSLGTVDIARLVKGVDNAMSGCGLKRRFREGLS